MWQRVCEAWYSVAPKVLEVLYNLMPRKIANVIKAKGGAMKYYLYYIGIQVCCCVFI